MHGARLRIKREPGGLRCLRRLGNTLKTRTTEASNGCPPAPVFIPRVFDSEASRVGASPVGRNTYDESGWAGGGTPHPHAPLVLQSHRDAPSNERQTLVTTGIEDAVAVARAQAGEKDVALMGRGVVTAALCAGLLDEVVLDL